MLSVSRRRIGQTCALVAAVALWLAWSSRAPASAEPAAPECRGRDLLPEMRQSKEVAARIDAAAKAAVNGEAMLWRISRPGVPASYLFGTVHLSDERVTRLPAPVAQALDGARRLVLEVADLSPQALGAAVGRLRDKVLYLDGRSLSHVLTPDELAAAREATGKAGVPAEMLAVARPWLVSLMMALTDCERARIAAGKEPLDLVLAASARKRGVPVTGLETIDDQLSAMAAVPEADQLTMLRATLKLQPRAQDLAETMLQRYLARETAKVWALQVEVWREAGFEAAAFRSLQREMVTLRNERMRDAALPVLAEGGAFIAVGALHLVGERGLVALFRQAGYDVTAAE